MATATELNKHNMMPPAIHEPDGDGFKAAGTPNVKTTSKVLTGQSEEFVQPLSPRNDTTLKPGWNE
jgi:hypothetical protein